MFSNDLGFNGNSLLPSRAKYAYNKEKQTWKILFFFLFSDNSLRTATFIARPRNYENLQQGSSSFIQRDNFNSDSDNFVHYILLKWKLWTSIELLIFKGQSSQRDFSPRREANNAFSSDSFQNSYADMKQPSVHDIIRAKNTNERIKDLERTNLKLRRMLSMSSLEKQDVPDTAALSSRTIAHNLLGPPVYAYNY